MVILASVQTINEKMSDRRFQENVKIKELHCLLDVEIAIIMEQTDLSATEALFLSAVIMQILSRSSYSDGEQCDISNIADMLELSIYDILINHQVLNQLVEKGFLSKVDYRFTKVNKVTLARRLRKIYNRIPSVVPQLNISYELSESFVKKLIT